MTPPRVVGAGARVKHQTPSLHVAINPYTLYLLHFSSLFSFLQNSSQILIEFQFQFQMGFLCTSLQIK
ncbi:hypothetical protein L6452_39859 [Arctium lappa]|uniref:Uncharacterized protein n=1 Tax=Arctium lappa TaxID=4217 RepID=A0ACB8XTH9_ARCLA|nr:hypothetical protein L6452_39859 [Arctium lappa]